MAKKVAVVGGSGNLAREVIDEILARGSYQVVIFSRGTKGADLPEDVLWKQVDYDDQASLVDAMKGIDTVLSFLATADMTVATEVHKKLIDAAMEAGVRRFAPSEWAAKSSSEIAHYKYKDNVRRYLEEVNSIKKKIEYCLFQPGFFTDYFGHLHSTTKHFATFHMFADFQNRRAIISGDGDAPITLTTVRDLSRLVAQALEYTGVWPTIGGMRGTQTTVSGLIALGEKLRGPFKVEKPSKESLEAGNPTVSWFPLVAHPGVPVQLREHVSKAVLVEYVTSVERGAWSVTDDWNKLLPDFEFTSAESYLGSLWK
ncbi:hypothetical protein NW759_016793 [Fusarium solani]|nr:hypothetical protein NW759_016793 [Fusarium solani]